MAAVHSFSRGHPSKVLIPLSTTPESWVSLDAPPASRGLRLLQEAGAHGQWDFSSLACLLGRGLHVVSQVALCVQSCPTPIWGMGSVETGLLCGFCSLVAFLSSSEDQSQSGCSETSGTEQKIQSLPFN